MVHSSRALHPERVHELFYNPTYFTFIRENFLFYIKVHACIKHVKRIKMPWSGSDDDAESAELS